MTDTPRTHHIFCNGSPKSPVDGCRWCAGPQGLWAHYPYEEGDDIESLVKRHFPDAKAL